MSNGRSPYSTGACMGLPVYWRVSDLPTSYGLPVVVINAVSANTLSAAIPADSHSVELLPNFSDGATSADISLLMDDGTGTFVVVGVRRGVNALSGSLYFGPLNDNTDLKARALKVQISNYAGTGTISVSLNRQG